MAERRMFAKTIIDSDAFIDMPLSTQALYFHLSMRADDDGFINNPKKIQRMIGASDDDSKLLVMKKFIIPFESGVVVIKHWKIHNYIQKDRYKETPYRKEKAMLEVKANNSYSLKDGEEIKLLEVDEEQTPRQKAYAESNLPYSFDYKIRNAFVGKECPVCGCTMNHANNLTKPSIQHNIPISKGGKHELGNISVICASCNKSIQDKETEGLNAMEVAEIWDKMSCIQLVSVSDTQVRIGKDSIDKDSIEKGEGMDVPDKNVGNKRTPKEPKHKYGEYAHVLLTDSEKDKLISEYGISFAEECITFLDEYIEMKGYKAKNHYLAIKKWVVDAVKERRQKQSRNNNRSGEDRLGWIDEIEF